ncbi:LysR family transcriptional regulator [Vreelandella boliviensis]|uniref:LysR family transcriptional regulator n=1 Tax=Vreelandella boliviensis LC1 TaxID=1072583 RepID=A0A265DX64_9GAMM|nr:LysR family transcriptional regulator [Halomonas boliviensis]EHJ92514.1 Mau operon transcriptional activator [Halomonas boliviensis LC1]OZT73598.1 LysR family transcriptional regulator [Halomonas boliviensis LC1]
MKKMNEFGKPFSDFEKQMPRGWVWDDTRTFLAVARHGTLSGAAAELNLGIATLSRRIERLEKALKLPLFVRQQSGYQLTEEGAGLIEKAEALEAAAVAFTSGVSRASQLSGRVRLATAENLATALILPALPQFYAHYPGITLELVTDINTVNLHRRDADLALRMVRPERGNVTLRRLGSLGFGLYASPCYVAQRESNHDAGDFDTDAFITWGESQAHLPAAQWVERVLQGREPALTTTSMATQLAAAKAGLGIALLPHFLAREASLICVAEDIGVDQPIYLVIQTDLTQSSRIRAVADFLAELVASNRERLNG